MVSIHHFILDHRRGGPHVYACGLKDRLAGFATSRIVTTGLGECTDISLKNLRHMSLILFPLEILWNTYQIIRTMGGRSERTNTIFHVHGVMNLAPILAAKVLGFPVVWTLHETVSRFKPLFRIGLLLLPNKAVVTSVSERGKRVYGCKDAIVLPGGVNVSFWRDTQPTVRMDGAIRLVTVANLNPLKGLDLLLASVNKLEISVILTIIGCELGSQRGFADELKDVAADINKNTNSTVRFTGGLSVAGVRQELCQSDIFVLPSRSEACPFALLEAMAVGLPILASDAGDVGEILRGGQLGVMVQAGNVDAMTEGLRRIIAMSNSDRLKMGQRARERISQGYSLENFAARYRDLYSQLLGLSGINA